MKNFVNDQQKLPLFGIGPFLIAGIAVVDVIGIIISTKFLSVGTVEGNGKIIFKALGILSIIIGVLVWYLGAIKSDVSSHIETNKLYTEGIFEYVRNPMYSGFLGLFTGIILMWHNLWLLFLILIDWLILTVTLIMTEEKWLKNLYGDEYVAYCKRVNRCIPWFPRKN